MIHSRFLGVITSILHSDNRTAFIDDEDEITFDLRLARRYSYQEGMEKQKSQIGIVWLPLDIVCEKTSLIVPSANLSPLNDDIYFACRLYDWLLNTDLLDSFSTSCWDEEKPYFGFTIVDEPKGDKQEFIHDDWEDNELQIPDEFKYIDHEYCDQRSVGIEGDSFEGELYFPIPSGKYIRCHYNC